MFAQVVAETGATSIDDYDEAKERLDEKRAELNENERALERSKQQLVELQAAAEAEVERLREIESSGWRTKRWRPPWPPSSARRRASSARSSGAWPRRRATRRRRSASQPPAAVSADSSEGITTGNIGASGGEAGGRTGGGGTGTNPRAAGEGYIDAIICPVLGGSAYGDSWGAPRSGGRRHQGVDMLAPTGTPLQAVVSGYRQPDHQPARRRRHPAVRRQRQPLLLRPPLGLRGCVGLGRAGRR